MGLTGTCRPILAVLPSSARPLLATLHSHARSRRAPQGLIAQYNAPVALLHHCVFSFTSP